ncbi:MAG: S-adenosyl-l-methionine hydroxide adenosyltransferase family protein, partial [Promethearchaeota archaeon]
MKQRIITLLTDFGLEDPYVATMKGVILSICPTADIVDISHQIRKFNIREAAFKLAFIAQYFTPSTIHMVVIDPGVGSSRKSLVITTDNYIFIGPDNGVLYPAAEKDGIKNIIEIKNKDLFLKPVSNTFHGRDIFAPVAAHVANQFPLEKIGPPIKKIIKLD